MIEKTPDRKATLQEINISEKYVTLVFLKTEDTMELTRDIPIYEECEISVSKNDD